MCETRQHNGDLSVCLSICQVSVFTGLIQECGDNKNTLKGGYHILFISGCAVLCRAALKLLIMSAKILHPDLLFLCESPICDFFGVCFHPRVVHTTENISLSQSLALSHFFSSPPSSSSSPTGLITHKHSFLSLQPGRQVCTNKKKGNKQINKRGHLHSEREWIHTVNNWQGQM